MSLSVMVLIGMTHGLIVGIICNLIDSDFINTHVVGGFIAMIGNALKMLAVPLAIFSLICGVTGIGDIRVLGRAEGKSFGLYLFPAAVAIAVAMVLAILVGPGAGFDMAGVDTSGITGKEAPTVCNVFAGIVPTNPIAAFANGEMQEIIFYVIIIGIAALMLGDRSKGFVEGREYMNELIMKVVEIVSPLRPTEFSASSPRPSPSRGSTFSSPCWALS